MHAPLNSHRPDQWRQPAAERVSPAIQTLVGAIALLALAIPSVLVLRAPAPTAMHARRQPVRVIPRTEVPAVEPIELETVKPADARAINAAVPFTTAPVPAARPFRLLAPPIDRARAIDCLAAAQLYEAGDDATGERAVAQVVLNRLRHPAFPKTVCGVVFQGAERSTGCQFTFTCDGALVRHAWPAEAWGRARLIADAALSGAVFGKVGYATHYHTDWVVPYWSASLDKVAAVGTHLFFRWTGWWGTPAAFSRSEGGHEPVVLALALYSPAHRPDALAGDLLSPEQRLAAINGAIAKLPGAIAGDANSFLVTIDAGLPAADLARLAVYSCGARAYCKFMAWTSAGQTPKRLPLSAGQISSMAFSYLRDRDNNFDKMLWNCSVFAGLPKPQCMKRQALIVEPPAPPVIDEPATATPSITDNVTAP